ncbi:hypothetical protein N7478_005475 [Penicillium angulare]|uniref:uncharacterized protein n=1 Tax=Penicillium angulare TaxID=116970 RepID=UPI002540DDB7|nr:uncharacterized protein N7478_005475 [Penicillium angulare]KAJ5280103.1 hypothetical protein N7478_005475 [Penicillium angulare]
MRPGKILKSHVNNEELSGATAAQRTSVIRKGSARSVFIVAQKYRQVQTSFGSFKPGPITATHSMLSDIPILMKDSPAGSRLKVESETKQTLALPPHITLSFCLQAMRELSTSWDIANRIGRNLENLYCNTTKMPNVPMSLPVNLDGTTPSLGT